MKETVEKQYTLPRIGNLDELFMTTENTIVLNDIIVAMSSEEIVDVLCEVSSADDDLEMVARCSCRKTTSNYKDGVTCKYCGTVCELSFGNIVKNDIWVSTPTQIIGVLNPQVYLILKVWLGTCEKESIIETLLDSKLPIPKKLSVIIPHQGFNAFYHNFDAIISYFAYVYRPTATKENTPYILELLRRYKDEIWCTHLPLVSKALQPITTMGNNNRYVDPTVMLLMKCITNLKTAIIDVELTDSELKRVERNFFKVYLIFIEYTSSLVKEKLAEKKAILRKHCFGTRFHCSARTVCVPIVGEHYGDEVHIPWSIGVHVWATHLAAMLTIRYHYSTNKAYTKVSKAINVYDYQVDVCMQTLIKESPYKGLPIILNRNPSLRLGAIQLQFVTKVGPMLKADPCHIVTVDENGLSLERAKRVVPEEVQLLLLDNTIKVSPLIINAPNADFDGDELNFLPIFEMDMVERFMVIHPSQRMISSKRLEVDGGDVTLSSQNFTNLTGWVNDDPPGHKPKEAIIW